MNILKQSRFVDQCFSAVVLMLLILLFSNSTFAQQSPIGYAEIQVLGTRLDIDTRADQDGMQYQLTAIKNIQTAVYADLSVPTDSPILDGASVQFEINGPQFEQPRLVTGTAAGAVPLPKIVVPGDYFISNVKLVDTDNEVLLVRDPTLPLIQVTVIDEILMSQVTSRPLTAAEIADYEIEIDEDNFQAVSFNVGLTFGSEVVDIDLPVVLPLNFENFSSGDVANVNLSLMESQNFDFLPIPNLTLTGFVMRSRLPDFDTTEFSLPPISGVIILPGNIGYLNQFFSVMLQTTNLGPEGSGLEVRNAKAEIRLPLGGDNIPDSGDDPLRLAETASAGAQSVVDLVDADGNTTIVPQGTNSAEFLVEGLREGTHQVDIDITADLVVPATGETVELLGEAVGVVEVANPTFDLVLSHPEVVREDDQYTVYAAVTNTSQSPANSFQLALSNRSLTGTELAPGESPTRTVATLAPGQTEVFEFEFVSKVTGEITGTVFLADEAINGSYVLTMGVGDAGIPLSPNRLSLPEFAKYLPDTLRSSGLRLLGQAYSNATAPNGALPEGMPRIAKSTVIERARDLGMAGLHKRFGDSDTQAAQDILMAYFGSDIARLDTLVSDEENREKVRNSMTAFDVVRRVTESGNLFDQTLAELLGDQLVGGDLPAVIDDLAQRFASRPAHLSFGVSADGPVRVAMATAGSKTGWLETDSAISRGIPHSGYLSLRESENQNDVLIVNAVPDLSSHTFTFSMQSAGEAAPTLLLPSSDGALRLARYPSISLAAGTTATAQWSGGDTVPVFEVDTNGDGETDQTLAAISAELVVDQPPQIAGVHQWGKGESPVFWEGGTGNLELGDSLGRLIGVLFDEGLNRAQFSELQFGVAGIGVSDTTLSSSGRLVFIQLNKPVGPFVQRQLSVSGAPDLRGNTSDDLSQIIVADPDLGDGARLVGKVVDAAGDPIANAQVKYEQLIEICNISMGCYAKNYGIFANISADFNGQFELDFVLKNSLGPYQLTASEVLSDNQSQITGLVNFDGQVLDVTVVLRGAGKIEGFVYNPDGTPLVGANPDQDGAIRVIAQNLDTGKNLQSWVDDKGKYEFPRTYDDGEGNVISAGEPEVGNYVLTVVNGAEATTGVADATLDTDGATVAQDIVLQPAVNFGRLTGTVYETDGTTAVAGVDIQIKASVPSGFIDNTLQFKETLVARVQSDEAGKFSIDQLPVGDIQVLAQRQAPFAQRIVSGFLESNGELDLTILLPGLGGTVSGIVRDSEGNLVPGAIVVAGPHATIADENGRFEINNLPMGEVTVFSQLPDGVALGTQVVSTTGPDDVQDIVVTLQPTGDIVGTLYESDRVSTVSNQKVQLWFVNNGNFDNQTCCVIAETNTDANGNFEFIDYPVGDYSVRVVLATGGDGGWGNSEIRFAGDKQDVDVYLRGIGQLTGRVVQSNGTPAVSDVIVSGKQWRIATADEGRAPNPYLEAIRTIIEQLPNEGEAAAEFAQSLQSVLDSSGAGELSNEFYILVNQAEDLSSDELGPGGEVLGRFTSSRVWVPEESTTAAAFGPFLAPSEVTTTIPVVTSSNGGIVDVGDIVLQPLNGAVAGTVYMPDGVTPVGENVRVQLNSIGTSGSICPDYLDSCINQPVLPNLDALTDANGRFKFPLAQIGSFRLTADTGVADVAIRATQIADIVTEPFNDAQGNRALNVRLFGTSSGSVPRGSEVEVDVVLIDAAGVSIVVTEPDGVTPIEGAEVTLKDSVAANDEAFGDDFTRILSNAEGLVELFPVPSGDFTVTARKQGRSSSGVFSGSVPVLADNGAQILATVKLGSITNAGGGSTPSAVFGTVSGQVLTAAGEPVINPTQITITGTNVNLLGTTDADGKYLIGFVPGGELLIEAYEPYSGRRGETLATLTNDGENVTANVQLIGVGSVSGEVLRNGTVVAGADVRLSTEGDGRLPRDLITRSDSAGLYSFDGVPVGDYVVSASDPESLLSGRSTGSITSDGSEISTDINLQASGQIAGTVYAAGATVDAEGNVDDGAAVVPFSEITIQSIVGNGSAFTQTIQADVNGDFISGAFVPVGEYRLKARAPSRADGVEVEVSVTQAGQVLNQSLILLGSGTVRGQIVDSLGTSPIDKAQVTLVSRSPYSSGSVSRIADADGMFEITDVPVGDYTITVTTTLQAVQLGTTVDGTINANGTVVAYLDGDEDTLNNAIPVQSSGSITAKVLLADSVSFATDAVVEIDSGPISGGERIRAVAAVNALGRFTAAALPLGSYTVIINDPQTNASEQRQVTLTDNGEVVDLGTIILDADDPVLLSTTPVNAAENVATDVVINLTFNEPLSEDTVSTRTVVIDAGGVPLGGSVVLSEDMKVIQFTPNTSLPDESVITVSVKGEVVASDGSVTSTGIEDLAGRGMNGDQQFSFTTRDSTPPLVQSFTPLDGSVGVDVSSVVRIEFNEAIDPASVQSFDLLQGGQAVPSSLTVVPGLDNRVLVLTPDSSLGVNQTYRAVLKGPVSDTAGNVMTKTELVSEFSTPDTLAPDDLTMALADGELAIQGRIVTVVFESAATDIASIEFSVNGQLVDTITEAPFSSTLELAESLGVSPTLSAVAVDTAGNRGAETSLELQVLVNDVPSVMITSPSNPLEAQEWIYGYSRSIEVTFEVSDDSGLSHVTVVRDGIEIERYDAAGATSLNKTVAVPFPSSSAAGDLIEIVVSATDIQGDTGSEILGVSIVSDNTAPVVLSTQPQTGTKGVAPGQQVRITFSEPMHKSSILSSGILYEDGVATPAKLDWSDGYDELTITKEVGSFVEDSQITVVVPRTAEDMAGNTLVGDYLLQFATDSVSVDTTPPRIAYQRPASNATGVPVDAAIRLYADEPLSASSLTDALIVTQPSGCCSSAPIAGTMELEGDGSIIKFTPDEDLPSNTSISVETVSGMLSDLAGNTASTYRGSFTTETGANDSLSIEFNLSEERAYSVPTVPVNVAIEFHVEAAIDSATLTSDNLYIGTLSSGCRSTAKESLPMEFSLFNNNRSVKLLLREPLEASTYYYVCVANLKTTDGRDVRANDRRIQTGTEADEDSFEIVAMSPPNQSTNLPITTQAAVLFDEEVNLASAAAAITLEDGEGNIVDGSFQTIGSNGKKRVLFIPYTTLKPFETYTFTVSGVPDLAGNRTSVQSVMLTTGNHIDTQQYQSVFGLPGAGVREVGTNMIVAVSYNEPLDVTSIPSYPASKDGFLTRGGGINSESVVGNLDANTDATVLKMTPEEPLEPDTQYYIYGVSRDATDLSGNTKVSESTVFYTGMSADDTAPSLVSFNMREGLSSLPINARFRVRFDEPVRLPVIEDGWGLKDDQGNDIPVRIAQDDGAQVVELIPQTLFKPNSSYTVKYGEVTDSVGNVANINGSVSFSTGSGIDLEVPTLLSENPASSQTDVDASLSAIELQFDAAIDITHIDEASFELTRTDTNATVNIEVSADQTRSKILITPLMRFESGVSYKLEYGGWYYDLAANRTYLWGTTLNFTVQ